MFSSEISEIFDEIFDEFLLKPPPKKKKGKTMNNPPLPAIKLLKFWTENLHIRTCRKPYTRETIIGTQDSQEDSQPMKFDFQPEILDLSSKKLQCSKL